MYQSISKYTYISIEIAFAATAKWIECIKLKSEGKTLRLNPQKGKEITCRLNT